MVPGNAKASKRTRCWSGSPTLPGVRAGRCRVFASRTDTSLGGGGPAPAVGASIGRVRLSARKAASSTRRPSSSPAAAFGWWPRAKAAASPRDRPPAAGRIPPFGGCGRRRGTGGRPSRDRPSVGSLRSRLRPGFGAAGPVALWSICQGAHATRPGGPNPPRVAGSRAGSMRRQGVSSGTPATVSRPSHLAPLSSIAGGLAPVSGLVAGSNSTPAKQKTP